MSEYGTEYYLGGHCMKAGKDLEARDLLSWRAPAFWVWPLEHDMSSSQLPRLHLHCAFP